MNYISNLVSVIVPVYNCDDYLEDCLSSICNQTYNELQIIIIDDGSVDDSAKICEKYRLLDDRVMIISNIQTKGVSISRNKGLSVARGEYILFVDSDDCIVKSLVECCVNCFKKHTTDVVIFNYKKFHENNEINLDLNHDQESYNYLSQKELFREIFIGTNGTQQFRMLICNKMYKSSLVKKCYFPEGRKYGEDAIFTYNLIKRVKNALYLYDNTMYFYRNNLNSALNKPFYNSNFDLLLSYNEIFEDVLLSKSTDLQWVIYAYVIRIFELVSKIKKECTHDECMNNLSKLKKLIILNVFDVIKNKYISIGYKSLFVLLVTNRILFKKVYWKL